MSQGIVEAGNWHDCGVYVSVNCWGCGRISVQVDAQPFFGGLNLVVVLAQCALAHFVSCMALSVD